jgi:hypothetical protein
MTPWSCLVCGDTGGVDVLLNVLLFIPFAIGLRLTGLRWLLVCLIGGAMSLSVEFLQWAVVPGRDPSLSDVLANTTGTALGAALAPSLPAALRPTPEAARRLMVGGAVAVLLLQSIGAVLLRPWIPAGGLTSDYQGSYPGKDDFRGWVDLVVVDDLALADGRVPDSLGLSRRLLDQGVELRATVRPGPPTDDWASIFWLGGRRATVLAVYQGGADLVVQFPSRAAAFRFRPPGLRLPRGLEPDGSAPLFLTASARGGNLRVSASGGAAERDAVLGLSPALAWGLALPFEYGFGPEARLLGALWLAALVAPLGYWAAASGRRRTDLAVLGVALVIGVGLIPAVAGFPPAHWSEWAGALAGAAVGWAGRHLAAYLEVRCGSPSIDGSSSS